MRVDSGEFKWRLDEAFVSLRGNVVVVKLQKNGKVSWGRAMKKRKTRL